MGYFGGFWVGGEKWGLNSGKKCIFVAKNYHAKMAQNVHFNGFYAKVKGLLYPNVG